MAEQRCIICGNIVKFNSGEDVAVCEFCETMQKYDGEIVSAGKSVEPERGISTDTPLRRSSNMASMPLDGGFSGSPRPEAPAYVNRPIVPDRAMHERAGMPPYKMPPVYPEPPKKSSAGKIVGIVLGSVFLAILMLVVFLVSLPKRIETAQITVDEIEVGQSVSDIVITSDAPDMYTAIVDKVYYYDYDSGANVYLSDYDTIDKEQSYYVVFEFVPQKRYKFDHRTEYYINGLYANDYYDEYNETNAILKEVSMYAVDNTKETIQISSDWSSYKSSVNGYEVTAKELYRTAEDCIEFTINFQVTDCTNGDTDGNWCIYVRNGAGSFYKVNTFYYSGRSESSQTTYFSSPTDIDDIVVVPERTRTLSWSHKIYPKDFVVKTN